MSLGCNPGLYTLKDGTAAPEELKELAVGQGNVDVLPAGALPTNQAEYTAGPRARAMGRGTGHRVSPEASQLWATKTDEGVGFGYLIPRNSSGETFLNSNPHGTRDPGDCANLTRGILDALNYC